MNFDINNDEEIQPTAWSPGLRTFTFKLPVVCYLCSKNSDTDSNRCVSCNQLCTPMEW